MTPPRLTEVECPNCRASTWIIDSDCRGLDGVAEPYGERTYWCPGCGRRGPGWTVKQQSPPAFLLQPHNMYPMTPEAFAFWVGILKANFPDHPRLAQLGKSFYPRTPEEVRAQEEAHRRTHPVVEMRDQDGSRMAFPEARHAVDWLEVMRPRDSVTFVCGGGAELRIAGPASGPLGIRRTGPDGSVQSEASDCDPTNVRSEVLEYLKKGYASSSAASSASPGIAPPTSRDEGARPPGEHRASDCFVCNPSDARGRVETPFGWSSPRWLCSRHHDLTFRLEDGQLLDVVLDRVKPDDAPLEGSLLGWIFNPVSIEEPRRRVIAWADFIMGGRVLVENRFFATTYFEFTALEHWAAVDLLFAVRSAGLKGVAPTTKADLLSLIVKAEVGMRQRFPDLKGRRGPFAGLEHLICVWNFQSRLTQLRHRVSMEDRRQRERWWPESWVELQAWIDECLSHKQGLEIEPGTEEAFISALREVAEFRFPPPKREVVEKAEAIAVEHLRQREVSYDIIPDRGFRCGENWVFYCRPRDRQTRFGGPFAVIVEARSGTVTEVGSGAAFEALRRLARCEQPTILCAPHEAQSPGLMERVVQLTGASLEDVVAVHDHERDWLFIGPRAKLEQVSAALRREGFSVSLKQGEQP